MTSHYDFVVHVQIDHIIAYCNYRGCSNLGSAILKLHKFQSKKKL